MIDAEVCEEGTKARVVAVVCCRGRERSTLWSRKASAVLKEQKVEKVGTSVSEIAQVSPPGMHILELVRFVSFSQIYGVMKAMVDAFVTGKSKVETFM